MHQVGGVPRSVFALLFETSCGLGTVFIGHLTVGNSSRTPETQDHAHSLRKAVWETGLSSQPDWTGDYSHQAGGPGLTSPAPSGEASQYQARLPSASLTFVLPIAAWCQPVHHSFRSANITFRAHGGDRTSSAAGALTRSAEKQTPHNGTDEWQVPDNSPWLTLKMKTTPIALIKQS